jgi:hypothetical protein
MIGARVESAAALAEARGVDRGLAAVDAIPAVHAFLTKRRSALTN